jgi:hypothetical protein
MRLVIRLASVSHLCGIVLSCLLGDYSHKQVIHCLPRACHLGTALAQAMQAGEEDWRRKAGGEGWRGGLARNDGEQSLWRGGLARNAGEESWRGWLAKTGWKAGGEGRRGMLAQKGWRRGLALPSWRNTDRRSRHSGSSTTGAPAFFRTAFFSAPPSSRHGHETAFFLGVGLFCDASKPLFFLALSFEPSGCVAPPAGLRPQPRGARDKHRARERNPIAHRRQSIKTAQTVRCG